MMRRTSLLAILASTGVALAAGVAAADEVKVIKAGPVVDAVKVVKDKQTGKLRAATEEEAAAMAAQPSARLMPNVVVISRPTSTIVQRADGSATVRRSLDDLDSLVAQRGADGKLRVHHNANTAPTNTLPKE